MQHLLLELELRTAALARAREGLAACEVALDAKEAALAHALLDLANAGVAASWGPGPPAGPPGTTSRAASGSPSPSRWPPRHAALCQASHAAGPPQTPTSNSRDAPVGAPYSLS